MKNLNILFSLLFIVSAFFACGDETDPKFDPNAQTVNPVITSPAQNGQIVFDKLNNQKTVIFSWDPSNFGIPVGAAYTLQMDKPGGDFSKSFNNLLTTSARTVEVTVKQLNAVMMALGLFEEKPTPVTFRLISVAMGGEEGGMLLTGFPTLTSATHQVMITPYKDKIPVKSNYYITGEVFDPTHNSTWVNNDAAIGGLVQPLYSDINDLGNGKYYYEGYFFAGKFKIVPNPPAWKPQIGQTGGKLVICVDCVYEDEPDPIEVTEDGWYRFDVNLDALTYSFTKISTPTVTAPAAVVIAGESTGGVSRPMGQTLASFNPYIWFIKDLDIKMGGLLFNLNGTPYGVSNDKDGAEFPYGKVQSTNFKNVQPLNEGKYRAMFNALTNEYIFIPPAE
jgi:hypothetical protein